jgi:hypothetical protein
MQINRGVAAVLSIRCVRPVDKTVRPVVCLLKGGGSYKIHLLDAVNVEIES